MELNFQFIAVVTFGSIVQEIAHWFELRSKLKEERVKEILKSKGYWLITILMVSVTGLSVWLLFGGKLLPRNIQFILGASFPLIFKKIVSSVGKKDQVELGDSIVRDYFLI